MIQDNSSKKPPLIITLKIDEASQRYFSEIRKKHFPKHVNYLDAHLTLFHKLPSDEDIIDDTLRSLSKRNAFEMGVAEIKNIGNGNALAIESAELQVIHIAIQKELDQFLISQDRQKLWPHITVQNKVTANKAQILFKELSFSFKPFNITATGFSTWLYLNGPWEHKADYLFE